MNIVRKFLSKIIAALLLVGIVGTAYATTTNMPMADIGDHGTWATENNRQLFIGNVTNDIGYFQESAKPQQIENFVPVEAKVGMAFMNAFSYIGHVLDSSLVRFVIIFIILAYCGWLAFEAYTIITGKSDAKSKIIEMIKKGAMVFLWAGILTIGPAKTFMMVMLPILQIGTFIADVILNAVTETIGVTLPDTCAAIREYAAEHTAQHNILSPTAAADIMCIPTRLAGLCYGAVATGWTWIKMSIGVSAFGFVCGMAFVIGFIWMAWKFAFIAFGVIADLFLGVLMLPFTALAETIGKTSHKGILGDIFNGFMGLFSAESLKNQISRFIDAALHFIALSVIIAICTALLSGIVTINTVDGLPQFDSPNFFITILIIALTMYMTKNAMKFATEFGGAINTAMGDTLKSDAKNIWNKTKSTAQKWWKIIRDGR